MNAIIENMMTRRSVRAFKKDAVPAELIKQVVEAGTWAASGHDRQPWAIIAVTNPEVIAKLSKANASFFEHDVKDPFYGAPAVIIVLTKKSTPTYVYDGSLVLGNMMLAAHSLGLGSCWIHRARQEFETETWKEWLHALGIEGDYEGIGHLALGYTDGPLPKARPRKDGRVFWVE